MSKFWLLGECQSDIHSFHWYYSLYFSALLCYIQMSLCQKLTSEICQINEAPLDIMG